MNMSVYKYYIHMSLNKDTIDVVYYHDKCCDGFTSAFIIWYYNKTKFGLEQANNITYIPCSYYNDIECENNKNVIMCDFSLPFDKLKNLIEISKSFLILDHHKTSLNDLQNIPDQYKIFDMKKSGAGLTWDYFYPGVKIPQFIKYVQDRDLWTKKYVETDYFSTYVFRQSYNFELYETYLNIKTLNNVLKIGKNWYEHQKNMIDESMRNTRYVLQMIDNEYKIVLYINTCMLKSDLGSEMFKKFPFGDFSCVWDYDVSSNETRYSLRSTDNRQDVEKIAKKFGGGGHRNASGVVFKNMVGILPYDVIEDDGLLHGLVKSNWDIDNVLKEYMADDKLKEFMKVKCNFVKSL